LAKNYLTDAMSRFLPSGFSFFSPRMTPLLAKPKDLQVGDILVDPSKLFATWATTPYNPDILVTKLGLKIYDQMKVDEQVKACLAFKKAAVLSPGWELTSPGDEAEDWEPTAFVRACFEHIPMGMTEVLKYLMLGMDYGYSVTEKVYGEDLKWAKGKVGLKKVISLMPHYIDFRTLPTGELIELTQRNLMGSPAMQAGLHIPVDKCVVYTHDKEFENYYGRAACCVPRMVDEGQRIQMVRGILGETWDGAAVCAVQPERVLARAGRQAKAHRRQHTEQHDGRDPTQRSY